MFWFFLGLAGITLLFILFVINGRREFYLDQAKPSKDNSLKRFVRYGNIVICAKMTNLTSFQQSYNLRSK